jgi:hypothetical protein
LKSFAAPAVLAALLTAPTRMNATSCTMQAELLPQDREALSAAAGRLAAAVVGQDFVTLKSSLLPAVAQDWEGIHQGAEAGAQLMKGGQIQLENAFLLDSSSQSAPADTQFFCSDASGALNVTLTMRALPPGRYAVVLAHAAGAPLDGQLGLILVWNGPEDGWKLGGLTARPGSLDGQNGVEWWKKARDLARDGQFWSAWYAYEAARALLLPVEFLSSPNLDKLNAEQSAIQNSPQQAFPLTLPQGDRSWKIDSAHLDMTLLHADLGLVYDSTGVTDPAALRTEAIAVMSTFLKAHPELRQSFHGMWAYAVRDGKTTPVLELPMAQIP